MSDAAATTTETDGVPVTSAYGKENSPTPPDPPCALAAEVPSPTVGVTVFSGWPDGASR